MNHRSPIVFVLMFLILSGFLGHRSYMSDRLQQLMREKKVMPLDFQKVKHGKLSQPEEVALGKLLFNDKILSRNENVSCASCHIHDKGFSNASRSAKGTRGNELSRHVPHLYNLVLNKTYFWDGRATSLEEQFALVLTSREEMDMNFKELIERLKADTFYTKQFSSVYPRQGISKQTITKSIVAFEKSLTTKSTRYDNFLSGDSTALTSIEKQGLEIFIGKANCIACHNGPNLTDNTFHNVGVITNDLGRHNIDKVGMNKEFDSTPYPFFSMFKAFKTPTLRNVSKTAPYFHDGSKSSLADVIDFYNRGGENPDQTGLAKEIRPLHMEEDEKKALLQFLQVLSSDDQ